MRIGLSVVLVAALWWGLSHWLDQMLVTLLPGAVNESCTAARACAVGRPAECRSLPEFPAGIATGFGALSACGAGAYRRCGLSPRRAEHDVDLRLDDLPEATYRQPVVLVCGDLPLACMQQSPVLTVTQGCWIRVEEHQDLQQVARRYWGCVLTGAASCR